MAEDRAPLPLTIISGYLGAGKTTLVNHLLRNADGRRLVVLVNDFGDLPIDFDLIESVEGDTINLANGCACCSMGGDLYNALVDVLDMKSQPDHLIIEASGVADPVRIANIARAEPDLRLDAILSLVDVETFSSLVDDTLIGETFAHQLTCADLIALNKIDLVSEATHQKIAAQLRQIAPPAAILSVSNAAIPLDIALGAGSDHIAFKEQSQDKHADIYYKWSITGNTPLDRENFEQVLAHLDKSILRIKGIVWFLDSDNPHEVQCVGPRCIVKPVEINDHRGKYRSGLVAIGLSKDIGGELLENLFAPLAN